jgi:hypothetical protein
VWGLASFAFGAIDDELPNDQLFIRASKTRLNECEFGISIASVTKCY